MKKLLAKILALSALLFGGKATADQILPVVANAPGAQGAFWKTDVQVKNPYSDDKSIKLQFQDKSITKTIPANSVLLMENVLEEFGIQGFGPMELIGDEMIVAARTFNSINNQELGQGMKAYALDDFLNPNRIGYFIAGKNNSDYRTNIGLQSKNGGMFDLFLYDAEGNLLKSIENYYLSAGQYMQTSIDQLFGVALGNNNYVKAIVKSGDLFMYGSVIQNLSGDGNFMEASRVVNVPSGFKTKNRPFFHEEIASVVNSRAAELAEILSKYMSYDHNTFVSDYPDTPDDTVPEFWSTEEWTDFLKKISNNDEEDLFEFDQIFVIKEYDEVTEKQKFVAFTDYYKNPDLDPNSIPIYDPSFWGLDRMTFDMSDDDLDAVISILESGNSMKAGNEKYEKILPVVANSAGAQGSYWKTDVQVLNPDTENNVVTFSFGEVTKNYTIEPGKVLLLENVLEKIGASQGVGTLKISATRDFIAGARTFNSVDGKELGQYMKAYSLDERLKSGQTGFLIGAKDSVAYRTNMGLSSIEGCLLEIGLLDENGNLLETIPYSLGANGFVQMNASQYFSVAIPDNYSISIKVNSGDVFAYGSVVHNATGDGNFQQAQLHKNTGIKAENQKYDQLFLYSEAAPILNQHAGEFAEIAKNGKFIATNGKPVEVSKEQWEYFIALITDGIRGPPSGMEMDLMLIDEKRNHIIWPDTSYGYDFGWDAEIVELTEQDMDNFTNLFLHYYFQTNSQ